MRHIRRCTLYLLASVLVAGICLAEDAVPAKFYKLDFVVKEVEAGKVLNTRSYSATVSASADHNCRIRTGNRVPVPTVSASPSTYTYLDVGVNIDCFHMKESQGELSLDIQADISSLMQETASPPSLPPIVRQNKWGSTVIVPLKKPTVVFSSDDVTGKRQMQLELTATPIA
jgi:hypothetical protein